MLRFGVTGGQSSIRKVVGLEVLYNFGHYNVFSTAGCYNGLLQRARSNLLQPYYIIRVQRRGQWSVEVDNFF